MSRPALQFQEHDFDTEFVGFTARQMEAIRLLDLGTIKFLLYGGALGGGKSFLLRWYGLRRLYLLWQRFGIKAPVIILACEDYTNLRDRQLSKIEREFPPQFGRMHADHRDYGRCWITPEWMGGGVLAFRNLDDPSKYASAEFAGILVDELTKNSVDTFDHLRTRLRWPGLPDVECQFVAGSNPGGVGHGWVKQLWIDRRFPDEFLTPQDLSSQFAFVPSLADDNPHLGADYWAMLETLPPTMRKAFRYGDWNVFIGQAFPEFLKVMHVIKPVPIPDYAPLYTSFDWGFGAPFSHGWWWVDADGRLYRFAEWYGWNGRENEGLRLTDPQIAQGIIDREKAMGIWGKQITRIASHDCWNKKPDYKGAGQGPPTSEEFAKFGLFLVKGDPDRALKIRQFHERLRVLPDAPPMMLIYDTCQQFLRTIPNLMVDKNNPEDVNTKGEDHIFDESALMAMARPMTLTLPKVKGSWYDARIDRLERGDTDSWERIIAQEQIQTIRELRLSTSDGGFDDAEMPEGFADPEEYESYDDMIETVR